MRKSIRLARDKDGPHDLGSDDLLSRLSDDILVSILSYLPLKDAAVTSMLSRRWGNLWCHRVRLDFDLAFTENIKFINWVNGIIRQHKNPTIDEFKIYSDLDIAAEGAIAKWIEFANSKNVQRLELDFMDALNFRRGNYVFPDKILDRKCGPYATVMEMKFLKALILKNVDVNDEGLNKILNICPVLEHLSIDDSDKLEKAKIDGKGLALKSLIITYCYELESIEICDSNIVSFNYTSYRPYGFGLRLNNLQKLEKIAINDNLMTISDMFSRLSCCIPHLQALQVQIYDLQFYPFPTLPKLKELVMEVGAWEESRLYVLTSLVECCPSLKRFTTKLFGEATIESMNREVRQTVRQPHQHLEAVEIDVHHGWTDDLELATYFLENSAALKKVVIKPYVEDERHAANEIEKEKVGFRCIARQQLEPKTPVGVELDDLHDLGPDDQLSRLPDDILVSIMSYLPLKDAAITSKVSRRWRYVWCQRVCLKFEDKERSGETRRERDSCRFKERNKYIHWVNRIIRQHKSPIIDKFRICFDLDKNAKGAIGKWIEFAISKRVHTLELDLRDTYKDVNNYVFPDKLFDKICGSLSKRPSINVPVRPYATAMEINFLKALILKRVDVTDECLTNILSNCPVLEHLYICRTRKLVKAKIHGKGLALKNLEIISCIGLKSIKICDSNIVSFKCGSYPISLTLNNLQKLEKISIREYKMKINDIFCKISICIPSLQVLELQIFELQKKLQFFPFPKLLKLKQLIMEVVFWDEGCFHVLTSLVEACPNLQRFTIQLYDTCTTTGFINREVRQAAKQSHQHLKVVEIGMYRGHTGEACD